MGDNAITIFKTGFPVSMGAVGALAPTVFESVGAGTHWFWQLFSWFHQLLQKRHKKCYDFSSLLAKNNSKHPQYEIPNKVPISNQMFSFYIKARVNCI